MIDRACAAFGLAACREAAVVPFGYEDCNVVFSTAEGRRHVAKILLSTRPPEYPLRLTAVVRAAIDAGVNHPTLYSGSDGAVWHLDRLSGTSVLIMDCVEGQTFLQSGAVPDSGQLVELMRQVACLHTSEHRPPALLDPWAVQNMKHLLAATNAFVPVSWRPILDRILARLMCVKQTALPHALVHGDLTKGNVIVTPDQRMWVIDFGVANYLPRVQELAVVAANLLHGDRVPLLHRAELVGAAYEHHAPLTPAERAALPVMVMAAASMEMLGALYERHINGNTTVENDMVLALGLEGVTSAARSLGPRVDNLEYGQGADDDL